MSRAQLIEMTRHNLQHAKNDTVEQAPEVARIAVENYFDPDRFELEVDRIFRRMPLMLAMTCELPNPGDYRALNAVGMPILIIRQADGSVRAFVNSCRHRGAQIMPEGVGNTHRFTCPYHAWTYKPSGELIGVFAHKDFGDIDKSCYGLTPLPVLERAGLIWVIANPDSQLDMVKFLSGYDSMLGLFGFESWHMFAQRTLKGPNWKIAYDGYLDLYHLPILHKDTFGSNFPHRTLYYGWGPHQRVSSPDPSLIEFENEPTENWPTERMLSGVWTIFPHVSIASFDGGGRGVMLSQLFPGENPGESYTVQNYVMEKAPTPELAEEANQQFEFLKYVVQEEDYATGLRQQTALKTQHMDHVLFGRNETGGQVFHGWVEKLLNTDDKDLDALFSAEVSAG